MKNYFATIVLGLICAVCLIGCSKDAPSQKVLDGGITYISLNLDASYLLDAENPVIKSASSGKYLSQNKATTTTKFNASFYSEFTLEETNRNTSKFASFKSVKLNKLSAKEGTTMPTDTNNPKYKKMEVGVKYMVLIFDHEDNHVGSSLATVGEETRVPVRYNENYELTTNNYYRIVAFTFNTKDAAHFDGLSLDPSQTNNNPQIVFPSDKEFYYHNSDFLLDPKANYENPPILNVIFFPQTVRVGITVDARGVDANVKKVSGSFSSFGYRKTARFGLKLNRIVEKIDLDESAFPYDFTIVGDHDSLSISRFVYMDLKDGTAELSNFNVVLKELVLQRKGDAKETTVLTSPATKSYNFGNINLTKGKYFNGRINLFSGFQLGNVIWSYGNLYYDAADTTNAQYKFRNDPSEGYKTLTDYWVHNKQFPRSESSGGADMDPCTLVYPGGWRMPTKGEAEMINLTDKDYISSYNFVDATGDSDERNFDYLALNNNLGQQIKFYAFGMRDGLVYSGEGVDGLFWTSTSKLRTQADILRITITSTGDKESNGSIKYPDFVVSSVRGLNIRCVRELRN